MGAAEIANEHDSGNPSRHLSHAEKVNHLIVEFERRGLSRRLAAPPVHRLLWMFGLKIPPPLFQGALGTFLTTLFTGWAIYVLTAGALYAFFPAFFREMAAPNGPKMTVLVLGLIIPLMSLVPAFVAPTQRARYGLPRWEDYPETLIEELPRPGRKRGVGKLAEEFPLPDADGDPE